MEVKTFLEAFLVTQESYETLIMPKGLSSILPLPVDYV